MVAAAVPNHRCVDGRTVVKIVRCIHKRQHTLLPINFGPRTTPATFTVWLNRLGLQLKPQF